MTLNNYGYNKNLQPLAVELRKSMTKAEACLWKYILKGNQLNGYSFRRQRPVLQYIADFMCQKLMLIIEIDGITHDDKIAVMRDKHREKDLTDAGFKVVRFTDTEVLTNMIGIKEQLDLIVEGIEKSSPPTPVQRGTRCKEMIVIKITRSAAALLSPAGGGGA